MENGFTIATRIFHASPLLSSSGNGKVLKDKADNDVVLPIGAKVVILKSVENNQNYARIITYWQEQYYDAYIPISAIDSNFGKSNEKASFDNSAITKDSFLVFLNDTEHLLYKRLGCYSIEGDYRSLLENTRKTFNKIKSKTNVTENTMYLVFKRYVENTAVNTSDLPKTIKDLSDLVFDQYNKKFESEITVCPLSKKWFLHSPALKEFYYRMIESAEGYSKGVGDMFTGATGSIFRGEYAIYIYQKTIPQLMLVIKKNGIRDKESSWLEKLDTRRLIKNRTPILIFADVWDLTPKNRITTREALSLNTIFGPFRLHPLIQLLIHELNEENYTKTSFQTHIMFAWTKASITKYLEKNTTKLLEEFDEVNNQAYVDQLYQDSSILSLIHINILFKFFH